MQRFKYMRHIIWLIILMLTVGISSAQQIPFATIFVENPFAFNPAVAGSSNGFKVRLNSRIQWMGFGDGPFTIMASAFGPHARKNIGYGVNLVNDKTGPISMLRANGAFATNIFITSDIRASFGLNLGFIQSRLDGTQLNLYDPNDPRVSETTMASFMPDAGAGVYIYHFDWYFGLSAQQLFNNNVKFSKEGDDNKLNRLKSHFYGYGGGKITLVNNVFVEPSILVRAVAAVPMQMDINARVMFDKKDFIIWGGLSARNTFQSFDDLSLIFGYIHERTYSIAIAYDFSFADIKSYTAGTIELVVGYNFADVKKGGKR